MDSLLSPLDRALRLHRILGFTLSLILFCAAGLADDAASKDHRLPPSDQAFTRSSNPYLSFLPVEARPDYRYWRSVMKEEAEKRRRSLPQLSRQAVVSEGEPNDTQATANPIVGFGTGPGENGAVDLSGAFSPAAAPTSIGPFAEDEGSITLVSATGLVAGTAVTISGTIGDGAFGSSGTGTGDFDFLRIPGVEQGQLILIDVDTASPFAALDTFIALYDSAGNIVALNEDEDASITYDSLLAVAAPADDDYFLSIGGSVFPFASLLGNPFDSASGTGVGSEGDYQVTISLDDGDQDWFSFELEACDILGVNLIGAGTHLELVDPTGKVLIASSQDLSGIVYPTASPLPGGGRAVLAHVAAAPGSYAIRALGNGGAAYTLEMRIFRPVPAPAKRTFVDFDGATLDPSIFGADPGSTTLSPLSSFLAGWGLAPGDENAVIDAILTTLVENLETDPRLLGPNGAFSVEVLNSRDHADPFGMPGVSRLIIGGTIPEFGLPTIGIAESIDPGNFANTETGVVLLDLLSRPAPDLNSLNTFDRAPGVGMVEFVGVAVGNIAAHEAGHFIGNYHTEQFNPTANLMDQGGNLPNTIGLGPDGIFGTADDADVDFGEDIFVGPEGFAGTEDTLSVVSCGCTFEPEIFVDRFELGDLSRWSTSLP